MNNLFEELLKNPGTIKLILELKDEEDLCMTEIQQKIGFTYAYTHYLICSLLNKGILEEKESDNKRIRVIILTKSGKKLANKLNEFNNIFDDEEMS